MCILWVLENNMMYFVLVEWKNDVCIASWPSWENPHVKKYKAVLKQFLVSFEAFMVKKQRQPPPFELSIGHHPSWGLGVVQVRKGLYASTEVCFSEKNAGFWQYSVWFICSTLELGDIQYIFLWWRHTWSPVQMVIPLVLPRFVFCFFKCVVRLFDEVKQSKKVKMSLKTLGSANVKNK